MVYMVVLKQAYEHKDNKYKNKDDLECSFRTGKCFKDFYIKNSA